LIQQLRAKYLETVNDAVGERVIGSKKSYLNKKKLYESVESIVEHENETPLFMKGRDPLLNAKGIGAVENYKLGNTFYYQKSDTEKTTNRKCLQADRNFFPLSAKIVSKETSPNFSQESSSTQLSSKNSSLLTILIKTGKNVQVNPLDIYASLSGKGDLNPLKLKIYRPSGKYPKKPISVVVKRIATVADVIGFSLYCFIEQKLEPKLTNEQLNPNMWTLRIVEEDGELDEDFPVLENEKITPFNFKINIEHFNSQTKNDLNDTSQILFSSMPSKDKAVIETPESFIRLKVLLYPRIQSLKNSILYVTNETYI
ncbi:unnamed protein product, partial [Pneumocystis jirovecii]